MLLIIPLIKWQYTHGVRNIDAISPDNWLIDQPLLDRPGNDKIQLQKFYSYRTNLPLYPQWQEYFRKHQAPTLIAWGKNDPIFPADSAHPYKRDLKNLDFHLLDTGHFALEEDYKLIAELISNFLIRRVCKRKVKHNKYGLRSNYLTSIQVVLSEEEEAAALATFDRRLCTDQFEDSVKKGKWAGYQYSCGKAQLCYRQNIGRLGSYLYILRHGKI